MSMSSATAEERYAVQLTQWVAAADEELERLELDIARLERSRRARVALQQLATRPATPASKKRTTTKPNDNVHVVRPATAPAPMKPTAENRPGRDDARQPCVCGQAAAREAGLQLELAYERAAVRRLSDSCMRLEITNAELRLQVFELHAKNVALSSMV